jgi:hypothetical protein
MWVAGGGFKAVENRVSIHDLHATLLHQMGIDHLAALAITYKRWSLSPLLVYGAHFDQSGAQRTRMGP